jgi:hypothetical protein
MSICERDRQILRDLAAQVREVAELPEMTERKQRWWTSPRVPRLFAYASPMYRLVYT